MLASSWDFPWGYDLAKVPYGELFNNRCSPEFVYFGGGTVYTSVSNIMPMRHAKGRGLTFP